ncbi:MAG TPA: Spy/CpxP family protein refolding chaperone [Xanthobacteraceae bacterium]|jgi:Spy/CpxP family protein refolding chaperone
MSEQPNTDRPTPRRGRGRVAFVILSVALAGGLFGALATKSFSQGFGPPWHGAMADIHMMGGPMGPAFTADRADRMVRHAAIELDASPDQQAKLQSIVKSAAGDLAPLHEKIFAARQQARDLLTAATVDRAAIEKLRAEQIATMDAASKRVAQALSDAADVLTPDQRRKLDNLLPPFGGYWQRWHRG